MKPIILFRADSENHKEFFTAKKYFDITKQRNAIPDNSLVIARYSCLPYFKELEEDLKIKSSKLIDDHNQFNYIANFEYYWDIEPYTFKTYFHGEDIPDDHGPLVVKGVTNSKKGWWKEKMFAENKRVAILTAIDLRADALIGQQDIIFRKYEKLKTYETLISGLPVTEEYRFFFYKDKELSRGYYWQNAEDKIIQERNIAPEGIELAHKVAKIVSENVNFFVVDVAQKESGEWIVVELNHGMMSGLSMCDADELYSNLKKYMIEDGINFN